MDEIRVSTWKECEARIREIRQHNQNVTPGTWFRGQANSKWPLVTTLERRSNYEYSFVDYYRLALRIKPEIETMSGSAWEMPSFEEFSVWAKSYNTNHRGILAYEYLAHLRHNGFPSPLLDWTHSPYVAAYFAFSGAKTHDVAIYIYSEQPDGMKGGSSNDPAIRALGQYVKTHRRHFRQQSRYTVCAKFDVTNGWHFVPHQRVFDLQKERYPGPVRQDVLSKIVIPASERVTIMTLLDEFNLNAFSLFGSEESHMETLAFREIELKPPPSQP